MRGKRIKRLPRKSLAGKNRPGDRLGDFSAKRRPTTTGLAFKVCIGAMRFSRLRDLEASQKRWMN